jgi:hypothetical protein
MRKDSNPERGIVRDNERKIIVHKNRQRAFWALLIVIFFIPLSGWLVFLGLRAGRPDVGWSMVLFGIVGLVAFGASAAIIIRTMRAPWHLVLDPSQLAVQSPTYDLVIGWESIAGIAVDQVNHRPGCVLVFDNVATVVQGAKFHLDSSRPDAVANAAAMQARMEENFDLWGYHFALPGRMLEMGPEDLADLLAKARTGEIWQG